MSNSWVREQERVMRVAQMETFVEAGVDISHIGNRRAVDGNKPGIFQSRSPVANFGTQCALQYCFRNKHAIYRDELHATGRE